MGKKAVDAHGKAGGKGAVGSEEIKTEVIEETPAEKAARETLERDRKVMVGGPGLEGGAFSYKFGDKEFTSQEALTEFLTDTQKTITDLKGKTTEKPPAEVVVKSVEAAKPIPLFTEEDFADIETALLTKPKETLTALLTKVSERTSKAVETRLEQRYQAEKVMEAWWSGFYDSHKELVAHKNVVGMVMKQHEAELAPMTMAKAADRLAELTQDFILSVGGKTTTETTSRKKADTVEGASTSSAPTKKEQEQTGPRTLSQAILARRRARQQTARA